MDPHFNSSAGNHLIGLGAGGLPPYVRPPPSLVVAPQPLRWSNHQEDEHPPPPLWKCESVIGHPQFQKNGTEIQFSAMETPPIYTQLGDQFGSKPEFEKQFSQSPGSASEIHETQWAPNPENEVIATREMGAATTKKKKKKQKFCTDEEELERELNLISGFIETRLVAHQERLHQRFTAAIERMERVRKEREDTWRAADAEAYRAHAAARAREQALASTREAVIVSYLEKMTGEKIDLPRAEALTGSRTGLSGPDPDARLWENINKYLKTSKDCDDESDSKSRVPVLKDDVTPPNSCLYNDNGDVHFERRRRRRKKKKNEMLEAMLEVEESNAQAHQLNQMDDHDQEDCDDDDM